jgi:hypothetical protein
VTKTERSVTYGIRAGSTRDLGSLWTFVDMIDYTVPNRVDLCAYR